VDYSVCGGGALQQMVYPGCKWKNFPAGTLPLLLPFPFLSPPLPSVLPLPLLSPYPPLRFPSLSLPPPLEVGPLIAARGLGERFSSPSGGAL